MFGNAENFTRLRFEELSEAPTTAGLYAWYGVVPAGPPDWECNIQEGRDVGQRNSRRLLRSHTARYQGPLLDIEAIGGFSTTWSGRIEDTSNAELQAILGDDEGLLCSDSDESQPAPKLQEALSSPELREILFKGLEVATPVFAAPLYIGVATNLQQRLRQHASVFEKVLEAIRRNPSKMDDVLAHDQLKNEFAIRALQRGFSPETVEVWIFDLEQMNENGLQNKRLRIVAEALEWLLNRWHRPPLGRR